MTETVQPDVSVVIPMRDRGGVRLDNCLRSLRWQDVDPSRIEIVISDFGSNANQLPAIRALAARHGARLVETPAAGSWNRAKALNIGIRAARGTIVLCTDADMIFQENFLSTVLSAFDRHGGRVIALSRTWDLPSSVAERHWEQSEFPALKNLGRMRQTSGTGACQAAPRTFYEFGHGYDEKLLYWGFEDGDMLARARRFGLEPLWISDKTSMVHQWHPTHKHDRPLQVHLNRLRCWLTRHVIVKNREGWGLG
jgi:glycosyltransferase involved in cell wall biosynthesis